MLVFGAYANGTRHRGYNVTYHFTSGGKAFALDADQGALYAVIRTPLPLSAPQADVLRFLLNNAGRQLSVAEIGSAVWGDHIPDGAVDHAIRAIMAALGDTPEQPLFIEALSQRGYRFLGGVSNGEASAPAPKEARGILAMLGEAGPPPHANGLSAALTDARHLGDRHGGDETYAHAIKALQHAAASNERLPPVALETVIDALGSWVR